MNYVPSAPDRLLLIGYRTQLSSGVDLSQFVPEFSFPSNWKEETRLNARKEKELDFYENAGRVPYLAELAEIVVAVLTPVVEPAGNPVSEPTHFRQSQNCAQRLCRLLNSVSGRVQMIAFDMRRLAKVLGAQCAIENHHLPAGVWMGQTDNFDMEHLLVPDKFPELSLHSVLKRLDLADMPEAPFLPGINPALDLWVCMQGVIRLNLYPSYHKSLESLVEPVRESLRTAASQQPAPESRVAAPVTAAVAPAAPAAAPAVAAPVESKAATGQPLPRKKKVFRPPVRR